jgi:magnesium-transporting ATPase (P-type)
MSVITTVKKGAMGDSKGGVGEKMMVFTKGAPEVMEKFLETVPPYYHQCYQYHMSRGKRVLALACKTLHSAASKHSFPPRSVAESQLEFISFILFDSDLKIDTRSVVKELLSSTYPGLSL